MSNAIPVKTIPYASLPKWARPIVARGFIYGCACGESYETVQHAWACRKCRRYLMAEDYRARVVYHTPAPAETAREVE